jgi:hypothetical protein
MAKNKLEQARAYVKLGDDLIASYKYWKSQVEFLKDKLKRVDDHPFFEPNIFMLKFFQGQVEEKGCIDCTIKNLGPFGDELHNLIRLHYDPLCKLMKSAIDLKLQEAIKNMESDRDRLIRNYEVDINGI